MSPFGSFMSLGSADLTKRLIDSVETQGPRPLVPYPREGEAVKTCQYCRKPHGSTGPGIWGRLCGECRRRRRERQNNSRDSGQSQRQREAALNRNYQLSPEAMLERLEWLEQRVRQLEEKQGV